MVGLGLCKAVENPTLRKRAENPIFFLVTANIWAAVAFILHLVTEAPVLVGALLALAAGATMVWLASVCLANTFGNEPMGE